MKVYVITKFKPFEAEQFVDIAKSEKEAISKLRKLFPNMRGNIAENSLSSDINNTYLFRVFAVEL